jgi:7,8-dihydropterin-6-yl-methyl-4-(beta-D-ribofuranosyl)aminobenzene 5'-phosphate synthase
MKVRLAALLLTLVLVSCAKGTGKKEESVKSFSEITEIPLEQLCITVIYDNTAYFEGLRDDWGFACVIDGAGKKILFDTGAKGNLFIGNLDKLACHPRDIDLVVLSHDHWDHTGGLEELLRVNPNVKVFLLQSFPDALKKKVDEAGADAVLISGPQEITTGAYTTGTMGSAIKEQALIITTDKGAVVITGCAHPGVVKIVKKAKELTGQKILLVMGGFHLQGHSEDAVQGIIEEFREMGVGYVGPCHCTGNKQIEMFRQAYEERFLEIGVGRVIAANHLVTAL